MELKRNNSDAETGNHDYQRELAEKLVRSIGLEEAIQVARDNQWYGVLMEIPFAAYLGE